MAKVLDRTVPHAKPELSVIVQCGCGCQSINLQQDAYIYSNVTGKYYVDDLCLVKAEEAEFVGSGIKYVRNWLDEVVSLAHFKTDMGVVAVG